MSDPTESRDTPGPSAGRTTSLSLLEQLRANDQSAWARLVILYSPLVHHWCGRWGLRRHEAEDVAQEVFQAAAAGLPGFRKEQPGDTFRGWLRGITRNLLLLHFRKNARHPGAAGGTEALQQLNALHDPTSVEDDDPPEEVDALYRRALEAVRSEFEEKTWRAFWLTAVENRPSADVAAETGVTPAAVRQARSRVLRRLKEVMGDMIT
jgi:RNA polymerase sigma-70 factor (ECF subfamily)